MGRRWEGAAVVAAPNPAFEEDEMNPHEAISAIKAIDCSCACALGGRLNARLHSRNLPDRCREPRHLSPRKSGRVSEPSDQSLCAAFDKGASANRQGALAASNPYRPSEEWYYPWHLGWLEEEGPTYSTPKEHDHA
jgi:hypothetical protein